MGHVTGPLSSRSCNRQASGGGCCCGGCGSSSLPLELTVSESALLLSALHWKQIQRINFCAFSHLYSQEWIRTDPGCQIHLQTFLNNPGHCCNLAAISLSRKTVTWDKDSNMRQRQKHETSNTEPWKTRFQQNTDKTQKGRGGQICSHCHQQNRLSCHHWYKAVGSFD